MPSSWDLVAGGDHEFDNSKKAKGMPPEHILVYTIEADALRRIVNEFPDFRSFLVMRSMARRAFFKKMLNENFQQVLFREKRRQHAKVVKVLGIANDFDSEEVSEDEEAKKKYDVSQAKTQNQRIFAVQALKSKLARDAVRTFNKNLQRRIKSKPEDPFKLRNRVDLQKYALDTTKQQLINSQN